MGQTRKEHTKHTPSQSVHVRIPVKVLIAVGVMADKKRQSRNQVIVEILAKATKRYAKDDEAVV